MFENKQDLPLLKHSKLVVSVAKDKFHFEFDND